MKELKSLADNWAVGKNGRLKAGSIFGRLFLPEFPLAMGGGKRAREMMGITVPFPRKIF